MINTTEYTGFLQKISEELDIPDHLFEDAAEKYHGVGEWLGLANSKLAEFAPDIYPQGSFRLGTVIRPITEADEYDIDLVCNLTIAKDKTTQANLKTIIGERLKESEKYCDIVSPSRRCWTLDFDGQFHMDVLPAIPNVELRPSGILLTDRELKQWQHSNPIGYAEWFHNRMPVIYKLRREAMAKALGAEVEDIPDWQVKTPLQRVIQLLKRHRDIYFQQHQENKPVSIIITTLAAAAYTGEEDIGAAFTAISAKMKDGALKKNGKWVIQNPVDPNENFADKWNEKEEKAVAFFKWLEILQAQMTAAQSQRDIREASGVLAKSLGTQTINRAAAAAGLRLTESQSIMQKLAALVPGLASYAHAQKPEWPVSVKHKVKIKGGVYRFSGSQKQLWPLTARPVPRNMWIKFDADTNTPPPYEVWWQVTNTGSEASSLGQLRGDFYPSDRPGVTFRWESTKYRGTHLVEAFVVKDRICVAKSGARQVAIR